VSKKAKKNRGTPSAPPSSLLPPPCLVFDCFSGIAGDMTLAALIDAGASLDAVRAGLDRLGLPAFSIAVARVTRGGIDALHLDVGVAQERTYSPAEMRATITAAALPERVTGRTLAAIDWLERGEAAAHRTAEPHLHEAGGVDALIDIAGTMLALEELGIADVACPVVTVGAGTIARTEHGIIPAAPGPAAAHILQDAGFTLRFVEAAHELVTPTGAAILAAVARPGQASITPMVHGYGAGTFDPPGRPNALRVWVGTTSNEQRATSPFLPPPSSLLPGEGLRVVAELAANIDDMTPALLANARDRLLGEGALDAWIEPIGMKKGRSASKLCALVKADDEARFADLVLRETTTLGVRATNYRRYEAERRVDAFASALGPVRVKVGEWKGQRRAAPEFEDVKALAAKHGLPAIEVQRWVERELGRREKGGGRRSSSGETSLRVEGGEEVREGKTEAREEG